MPLKYSRTQTQRRKGAKANRRTGEQAQRQTDKLRRKSPKVQHRQGKDVLEARRE